ncbi:MAG: WYL domain-containing protein [Clostridia bacterium]|nr:WYL domain-containing protein [Clostridia bacterium]
MEDKIKISLPVAVAELLRKDCADFKILKHSGERNFNLFINTLIANYYEEFCALESELRADVVSALEGVSERYKGDVTARVLKLFAKKNAEQGSGKSVTLAFKPTKLSEYAVQYIENVALYNESLSSFYRRMLSSYSQKHKNQRERIIHRENYTALCKAIADRTAVSIALNGEGEIKKASVYAVAEGKDELFNYVLIYDGRKNTTCRLATVRSVFPLSERAEIPEKNVDLFEKQIKYGAQYPFYNTDGQPIKVRLTEKGKELFKKIYLYRPEPVEIDGDVYVFECSANQVIYYFQRFGENAVILSPGKLGVFMRNYYHYALKKYRAYYSDPSKEN